MPPVMVFTPEPSGGSDADPIQEALDRVENTVPPFLRQWVRQQLDPWVALPHREVPSEVQDLATVITGQFEQQFDPHLLAALRGLAANFGPTGVLLAANSLSQWPALTERSVNPGLSEAEFTALSEKYTSSAPTIQQWFGQTQLIRQLALVLDFPLLEKPTINYWERMLDHVRELMQPDTPSDRDALVAQMHRNLANALGLDEESSFESLVKVARSYADERRKHW
jgi:hypothetical protein